MSVPYLLRAFEVSVISSQYVLNGGSSYVAQYGVGTGIYSFENVPETHPLAIISSSGITYEGDASKKFTKDVSGISTDFYYGDIKVIISADFGTASLYCYYHGYMGGQNMLLYQTSSALPQYDDRMVSNGAKYRIVCQNDGNFVVYKNSSGSVKFATNIKDRLWSPDQSKNLQIQDDGNFVVYDTSSGSDVATYATNQILTRLATLEASEGSTLSSNVITLESNVVSLTSNSTDTI